MKLAILYQQSEPPGPCKPKRHRFMHRRGAPNKKITADKVGCYYTAYCYNETSWLYTKNEDKRIMVCDTMDCKQHKALILFFQPQLLSF